jgi:hypothetical protein
MSAHIVLNLQEHYEWPKRSAAGSRIAGHLTPHSVIACGKTSVSVPYYGANGAQDSFVSFCHHDSDCRTDAAWILLQ